MSFLEIAIGLMLAMQASGDTAAGTLEARLRTEETAALARDARRLGDALRGASAFYQPSLTCTKCHTTETGAPSLGPDLTALGKDVADAYLVEAILEPSKVIKKGYETVTISTEDGRTVSGLLGEERADAVVIRDPGQDGKAVTVRKDQIEERKDGGASIMPAGLVNNLGTRQQFLDLVRYLMEIAEKGPARALELKPDPAGAGRHTLAGVGARHRSRRAHLQPESAELRARRGDLQPRLHQLPRDERPARLAADLTSVCLGRLQERRQTRSACIAR